MGQVGGSVTSGSLGGGQANWEVVFSHSETFFFLSPGEKCRSFIDLAPASEKGK